MFPNGGNVEKIWKKRNEIKQIRGRENVKIAAEEEDRYSEKTSLI